MIGIVIVAHGGLAREFLGAVEHVVGRQPGVVAIAIGPDDDRFAKQSEICAAADRVDTGTGVVIATDMFGGSPSNLSLRACGPDDRRILYGVSLPTLIKLSKSRHLPVREAVVAALDAGRKYIDTVDRPSGWDDPPAPDHTGGQDARVRPPTQRMPAIPPHLPGTGRGVDGTDAAPAPTAPAVRHAEEPPVARLAAGGRTDR